MLVGLEGKVQHLACLLALLVDKLVADGQKPREAELHNLVKVRAVVRVAGAVPVGAADGEQALQTRQHRVGVVRVQQLHGEVHKVGPLLGKVELEDALEDGHELLADGALGGGQDGE